MWSDAVYLLKAYVSNSYKFHLKHIYMLLIDQDYEEGHITKCTHSLSLKFIFFNQSVFSMSHPVNPLSLSFHCAHHKMWKVSHDDCVLSCIIERVFMFTYASPQNYLHVHISAYIFLK